MRATANLPKKRVRKTAPGCGCHTGGVYTLAMRLDRLATAVNACRQLESVPDKEDEEMLAFERQDAIMLDTLLSSAPTTDLGHMATLLAIASSHAMLKDAVNSDGNLTYNDPRELGKRLVMLDHVIGQVIYGLCLNGAVLHKAVDNWSTEDEQATWKNLALMSR